MRWSKIAQRADLEKYEQLIDAVIGDAAENERAEKDDPVKSSPTTKINWLSGK